MLDRQNEEAQIFGKVLSAQERESCQVIAKAGGDLATQRAAALLDLDAGSTQVEVAKRHRLRIDQVRYLVKAFKLKRMGLFSENDPDPAMVQEQGTPAEDILVKKKKKKKAKKKKKEKEAMANKEEKKGKKDKEKKKKKKDKKK